ncbi:MAG: bacillithiol biosynthesis cysteine-adding enzyme BshC, partial [Bacteroidia bacterium]|nr:bacillithiol biosynthesis cysteine-adding enzyme BshC [Bacteroidia bacterium]
TVGHQPVFWGGPLYVIYKAVGAIKLAREWEKLLPGRSVVPVFWVAGEDHDAAEVNHAYLSYEEKIVYPGALWGAVGRNVLTHVPARIPVHARRFYRHGVGWNEAFRAWLDKLLGSHGLIVLDGDDPELKKRFWPVVERELRHATAATAAAETTRRLVELGYAPQARIRDPNLFFLDDSGRFRIERQGDRFALKGTARTVSLQELLERPPVFFSPNVVLRPLYQETTLPSLAYLGGPGELAYWLQLKEMFATFDVPFPAVLRRPGATLFSAKDAQILTQMRFQLTDVLRSEAELKRECAARLWSRRTYEPYFDHILTTLDRLEIAVGILSPSQAVGVAAQKRKIRNFFERLTLKTDKEILNRNPRMWKALLRVKRRVQPDGFIQERTLNLAAVPLPPKTFVAFLMERLDVRNPNNLLILPKNEV